MKKFLSALGLVALGTASVYGAACSTTPSTNNLIAGAPGTIEVPATDTNEPCTVGTLTFSNFSYDLNTGAFTTGSPTVSTTFTSVVGSTVNFDFNPNLAAGSDLELQYEVAASAGGVSEVSLSYNGTGTGFVNEVVCSVPTVEGVCPTPEETLATIGVNSGAQNASATFSSTNPVYIFKDINSGDLPYSEVSQDYNGTASTPEPMTFSLLGAGLLGLGLLRKKLR